MRHSAEKYGLIIRPDGFVAVGPLQRILVDKARLTVSINDLYQVVATADKMRFQIMEGVPPGCHLSQITHIRAISGHSMEVVQDRDLLGKPVAMENLPEVLYHGTMLCNLEQIIADGLIPGGLRFGRNHVHLATTGCRVRDGSEIIIDIKTSALYLMTQRVYKTPAGVVLTPDIVPSSTFLSVRMNRLNGTEIWTAPRFQLGAGMKPGDDPRPPRGPSSSSSSGLNPGSSAVATRQTPSEHFVWLPKSAWKEKWHEWNTRPASQKDDVWTPQWRSANSPGFDANRGQTQDTGKTITNIPDPDDPMWTRESTKKCPWCTARIGIAWKVCPKCERSLISKQSQGNTSRRVRFYSEVSMVRHNMRRIEKSAAKKGFANAGDRLRNDRVFCENIIRDGPHRLPPAFVQLAIICLATFPAAEAGAVVKVFDPNAGGHSPVRFGLIAGIEGHSSEAFLVSIIVTLILVIITTCCGGCCMKRLMRAIRAFFTTPNPDKPVITKTKRHVGTMSQCTYQRELNAPRFRADNQGFHRAGEVTVEFDKVN